MFLSMGFISVFALYYRFIVLFIDERGVTYCHISTLLVLELGYRNFEYVLLAVSVTIYILLLHFYKCTLAFCCRD